jgi:hypothetical protein
MYSKTKKRKEAIGQFELKRQQGCRAAPNGFISIWCIFSLLL